MPINEYINDALRSGKTPEEIAAELNEAIKLAETTWKEEEAKAAEAAKKAARNKDTEDLIEHLFTWFDKYAPDTDLRTFMRDVVDYDAVADALVDLAEGLQQLNVITHLAKDYNITDILPTSKTKTVKGQKPMTDDEALKIFLESLKL